MTNLNTTPNPFGKHSFRDNAVDSAANQTYEFDIDGSVAASVENAAAAKAENGLEYGAYMRFRNSGADGTTLTVNTSSGQLFNNQTGRTSIVLDKGEFLQVIAVSAQFAFSRLAFGDIPGTKAQIDFFAVTDQ